MTPIKKDEINPKHKDPKHDNPTLANLHQNENSNSSFGMSASANSASNLVSQQSQQALTKHHPNFCPEEHIDFTLLSPESLKRYRKHFKLKVKTSPKMELINAVSNHFNHELNIDERGSNVTVYNFINMIKEKRGKLYHE